MTDVNSFKPIRIQWHRALFASHHLSGTEKALAAYLVNVRLNWKTGQLNPAVATIARDMSVEPRTVQRAVNNLERLGWFNTERGNGRTRSTDYEVTAESIEIAEQLRRLTREKKDDACVILSVVKPWQDRRNAVTTLSQKRRQDCHSNSIKNSKRKKTEVCQQRRKLAAPVFVVGSGSVFEREWDDRLQKCGRQTLSRLLAEVTHDGRRGYWLPATWPAHSGSPELRAQLEFLDELVSVDSQKAQTS